MSVIPLRLDGLDATVTGNLVVHQKDLSKILIENIDPLQLQPGSPDGNASYDFLVGDRYRDYREENPASLMHLDEIEIGPSSAVIIETRERIEMPERFLAQIVAKVSKSQQGLIIPPTKIDPGYRGKLKITVFNPTHKPLHLKRDEKFCSMYVMEVAPGVGPYQKTDNGFPVGPRRGRWRKLKDGVQANTGVWSFWAMVFMGIAALAAVVALFR